MRLKKLSSGTIATLLLAGVAVVASSSSADAGHKRDWRGYQSGTAIVVGLAPAATLWPYYGYRYGWYYRDYAPAGPFVDYPYQNCSGGVCWY